VNGGASIKQIPAFAGIGKAVLGFFLRPRRRGLALLKPRRSPQ
jgi:hypothetical protein